MVKLAQLCFYVATQHKPQLDDDLIGEDQDEVIDVPNRLTLSNSAQDQTQDQVILPHPGTTDSSAASNHPVNIDFPEISVYNFQPQILIC